jgi:hypothetical protein
MRTIQSDLLATIYAIAWYVSTTRIEAQVVLLRAFSPLRYDIGSRGLYVTVADLSQPGLYASSSSWYYRSISDEVRQAHHGHPSVGLPRQPHALPARREDVDEAAVREGLDAVIVRDPSGGSSPLLTGDASSDQIVFDDIVQAVFPGPWPAS